MLKRAIAMLSLATFAASQAFAQGCAMCYTSTAGAEDTGQSLNRGIVALLVPTFLLFGAVLVAAVRRADPGEPEE